MPNIDLDAAVNRFLGWKLPKNFGPDSGISFNQATAATCGWPTGTNLLDATQAREMLAYVLNIQEMGDDNIILGGQTFKVSTFSFDQLQQMTPAFGQLELGLAEGGLKAAQDILAAALPDVDLSSLKTTVPEILAAVPVVARVSGLVQLGKALAGKKL